MRLYNTLSRREEDFTPADGRTVRMYTCGLTVYARGHIGNFRTFVALDVLRRALEFDGWTVRQVRNYTDVDDRTIVESVKSGRPRAVSRRSRIVRGHRPCCESRSVADDTPASIIPEST